MDTLGTGIWQKKKKTMKKVENVKQTLQHLEYREDTEKRGK